MVTDHWWNTFNVPLKQSLYAHTFKVKIQNGKEIYYHMKVGWKTQWFFSSIFISDVTSIKLSLFTMLSLLWIVVLSFPVYASIWESSFCLGTKFCGLVYPEKNHKIGTPQIIVLSQYLCIKFTVSLTSGLLHVHKI